MKNILKRPLSILLAALMVMSLFVMAPVTAGAVVSPKLTIKVGENGKVVMNNGTFGNATDAGNIVDISSPFSVPNKAKITIADDHTANFVEGGSISISIGGAVSFYPSADNTGAITAIADEGYYCTGWYNGDTLYSSAAALSYQSISEDTTLTAKFAPSPVYTTESGTTINLAATFTRDAEDTTEFGIGNEFKNFEILGVQKKSAASTVAGEENRAVRFVAALNNEIVQDADDYGFIAVVGDDMDDARANIEDVTLENAPAKNVFTCKGTNNSVSGEYGKYASEKGYKYITFAINNIKDMGVAVMFYLRDKDGNVFYAPYTNNGGVTYANCAVDWTALISDSNS